jgi:hypothetical protein
MATKKKTKKKRAKSRKVAGKKVKRSKKAVKAKLAKKSANPKKKAAGKTKRAVKKRVRGKSQTVDTVAYAPEGLGARSGGQAGDLQGLSNLAGANSESVDELLEEGNAFEAEIVKGVQDADDTDEGEVHTHEVPEDDVPGEYGDKDE